MADFTLQSSLVPFQLSPTETVTNSKLNQGFNPVVNVSIASPGTVNGQTIVWDSATAKWVITAGISTAPEQYYLAANGTFIALPAIPAGTSSYLYINSHFR